MEIEDLERLVATTRSHEVLLLHEVIPTLDGWVREVFLRRGWVVVVEVRQIGYDEGGVVFTASPAQRDDALRLLEAILNTPISSWRALQPHAEHELEHYASVADVVDWVQSGAPQVPPAPPFAITGGYWSDAIAAGGRKGQ